MSDDNDEDGRTPRGAPLAPRTGFRARARRKLTDDVLGRIFQRRADGMTWDAACAEEGVHTESLRQLAKRDPVVGESYEQANAKGAEHYQRKIEGCLESGDPTLTKAWTGWAWLAERFHPTVFRKPADRIEQELTLRKEVDAMPEAELLAEAEAIVARAKALPADAVDAELEEDE
jgi:hypothetical protein